MASIRFPQFLTASCVPPSVTGILLRKGTAGKLKRKRALRILEEDERQLSILKHFYFVK